MQAKLVKTSAERFIDAVGAEPQDYVELTYSGHGESGNAMAITRGLFVSMLVEFRLGSDAVALATNFGDLRKAVAETRSADITIDDGACTIGGVQVTRMSRFPALVPAAAVGAGEWFYVDMPKHVALALSGWTSHRLAELPEEVRDRAVVRFARCFGGAEARLVDPVTDKETESAKLGDTITGGIGEFLDVPARAVVILGAAHDRPVTIRGNRTCGAAVSDHGLTVAW